MTTRRTSLRNSAPGSLSAPSFIMGGAPGPETLLNGRKCIYFGGTGYFGLHGNAEIMRAAIAALRKYGMHNAASRTGFGDNPVLLAAEKKIAGYFGTEESLYFVSGYLNGLFMAQGMAGDFDLAFADENSHFSVMDGIFSARKPVVLYKHRDAFDLRAKLKARLKAGQRPLVITDGVFPAYGAIAPVPEIISALAPYNGILCLDDAHAVGVLGANGRGTCEHFGIKSGGRIVMSGTLSKAFGSHGGFIPGSSAFIRKIRQTVSAYGGATSPPTPIAAGSIRGIELVQRHPEWREKLWRNVARVKKGMRELGFDVGDTPVPIVTWTLPSANEMKRVQKKLLARGVAVAYLKYAGAPEGGVLRASIFSAHTGAQIDKLLEELKKMV